MYKAHVKSDVHDTIHFMINSVTCCRDADVMIAGDVCHASDYAALIGPASYELRYV
jgi:hypothetical protein